MEMMATNWGIIIIARSFYQVCIVNWRYQEPAMIGSQQEGMIERSTIAPTPVMGRATCHYV